MTAAQNPAPTPSAAPGPGAPEEPPVPTARTAEQLPGGVFTGPGSPRRWTGTAPSRRPVSQSAPDRLRLRRRQRTGRGADRHARSPGGTGDHARRPVRVFGGRHQCRRFRRHAERRRGGTHGVHLAPAQARRHLPPGQGPERRALLPATRVGPPQQRPAQGDRRGDHLRAVGGDRRSRSRLWRPRSPTGECTGSRGAPR